MNMHCNEALPMVGAYLDGELSESRATLLRQHLLECHACRNSTQDGKTLRRWFAPLREAIDDPASALALRAPAGFSARVARRAFSGDTGEATDAGEPQFTLRRQKETGSVLPFVLTVTALAAALALVLAIAVRMESRPVGPNLSANPATMSFDSVVRELDKLDRPSPAVPGAADGERRVKGKQRADAR